MSKVINSILYFINYLTTIYSAHFSTKDKNCKIESVYRSSNGESTVCVKFKNDPRSISRIPAILFLSQYKNMLSDFSLEDVLTITGLAYSEKTPKIVEVKQLPYKYFTILAMVFGAVLLIANILSSKLIVICGYTFTGGQIVFPFTFILGDVITEVYGYKRSRQLIWGSIICNLVFIAFGEFAIRMPAAPQYHLQNEFTQVIGSVPRVIVASLIGYFCGEFVNSFIIAKLKILYKGMFVVRRLFGSSLISVAASSFIFTAIAFSNVLSNWEVIALMMRVFTCALLYEILLLPVTVQLIKLLKKLEKMDIFDYNTKFNPFSLDIVYDISNNMYVRPQEVNINVVS